VVTHASLRRAIVASSIAALIALLSVTTIAWLRRPRAAAAIDARLPAPLPYNDEDGSVYDLRLRMDELRSGLEQRLLESEQRRQQLQKQVEALLTEQEAMGQRMEEIDRELARLRRRVSEQSSPPARRQAPATLPPTVNTPATNAAPETTPPAGASGTPGQ
jgi:septal ring factor EnvC (AmiA/AmiB activator)